MGLGKLLMPLMKRLDMNRITTSEDALTQRPDVIRAAPDAPARFNVEIEGEGMYGIRPSVRGLPHMIASVKGVQQTILDLAGNPEQPKTRIPPDDVTEMETYARSMGVASIGYTKVPSHVIFRDKAVLYDNAIVLTMEMSKRKMDRAPSARSHLAAMEVYHHLGDASIRIGRFLQQRGYAVHAGHPLGGLALYPPLAQMAGLGWRGRHGMLITPEFGPRVRLTAVFTNIENLPLFSEENPHSWIPEFCAMCGHCIRRCPGNAIYETSLPQQNGLVTCVDASKCYPQFADNHGCSVCIKVCPFNRGLYNRLKRHVIKQRPTQRAGSQQNTTQKERT